MKRAKPERVKVTFQLPASIAEILRDLAEQRDTTMTTQLRRAIHTEQLIRETEKAGGYIGIADKDGHLLYKIIRL